MHTFDVQQEDWLELIDGVNIDLMGSLGHDEGGVLNMEELEHIHERLAALSKASFGRGPPKAHLPSAAELLETYDTNKNGTLELSELYNLIDGPLMSRVVGLLGARPLTMSFARRIKRSVEEELPEPQAEVKATDVAPPIASVVVQAESRSYVAATPAGAGAEVCSWSEARAAEELDALHAAYKAKSEDGL
jgi:hypothetical protein